MWPVSAAARRSVLYSSIEPRRCATSCLFTNVRYGSGRSLLNSPWLSCMYAMPSAPGRLEP